MVDELFLSSQGGLLCASVSRSLAGQMEGLDLVSVPRKEEFPIIPDCFPCNFTFVLHAKKTNNVISDPFDDDFCCSPIPALRREKKIRIVCKATIRKFCMMCSINCYMVSSERSFSGVGLSFCKWSLVLHSGFI